MRNLMCNLFNWQAMVLLSEQITCNAYNMHAARENQMDLVRINQLQVLFFFFLCLL